MMLHSPNTTRNTPDMKCNSKITNKNIK